MRFPQHPKEEFETLYLEDTDKPLPEKVDLSTRYAYFKTIARGGKSIIQSCKDLRLSRVICYKALRPEIRDDKIEQQRFLREARVTAMLQHPNTVPVYDLGRDRKGQVYFTMKLVHGYTLREILDFRDRYDLTQLLEVIVQVAHALDFAHTHGVAHRDIKPENILVGPFGEILLLDWGLAKVWNRAGLSEEPPEPATKRGPLTGDGKTITGRGDLQGTIEYMSPEQIRRDPDIDHRTDIFSLGAVLFEVLASRVPAPGDTVPEVMRGILEDQPPRPSSLAKYHVPKRLDVITLGCIAKDPDKRIQSAGELVRALQDDWRA